MPERIWWPNKRGGTDVLSEVWRGNLDEHKFCASCGNPLQTVVAVTEQKHSGVGIASSIMGIAAIVLTVLLIIVAGAMDASTTDGFDDNAVVVVGGCGVALMALSIVALSLGIVGLSQKDRKKMFQIVGTVLSSVMLLVWVALLITGSYSGRERTEV